VELLYLRRKEDIGKGLKETEEKKLIDKGVGTFVALGGRDRRKELLVRGKKNPGGHPKGKKGDSGYQNDAEGVWVSQKERTYSCVFRNPSVRERGNDRILQGVSRKERGGGRDGSTGKESRVNGLQIGIVPKPWGGGGSRKTRDPTEEAERGRRVGLRRQRAKSPRQGAGAEKGPALVLRGKHNTVGGGKEKSGRKQTSERGATRGRGGRKKSRTRAGGKQHLLEVNCLGHPRVTLKGHRLRGGGETGR